MKIMKKNIEIGIVLIAIISSLLMVMPVHAELAVEVWGVTYDSGANDDCLGVAVDINDNVIAIIDLNNVFYTIKLDSSGNEIWNVTFDGDADSYEAYAIATDSGDNVIAVGESNLAGDYNYYTIKYDSDGNELWNATYDGGGWDYATGVGVDSSDNVVVTGSVTSGATPYATTIKYNSNGNEIWNSTYTSSKRHRAVALDSNDNVIVVGGTGVHGPHIIKYNSAGTEIWIVTGDSGLEYGVAVAVDSNDNILVFGKPSGADDYYTEKYDSSGNKIWSVAYDSGDFDEPYTIAVDSGDSVIVGGGAGSNYDYYTIKYDSNSNEIWNVTFVADNGGEVVGIAIDSDNNIITAGAAGIYSTWDALILKYRNFNPSHGIYGWVYLLPSYSFANDTNIACANSTYSNSQITNKTGYYLFDDLFAGNYWINATKYNYVPNRTPVKIEENYNEILIDDCDAISNNGNWESNGTVTLDTTNKKEGIASINVTTNSLYTFRKNFTISIDASDISKSTGFLAFWYYVDNTTRLGDYSTITIGNGTYKGSNNISWIVSNSNYGTGWGEIYLPLNEGTETGTLNMGAISWFDMNVNVTNNVTQKIDYLRFVQYPYTLHNIYLELEPESGVGTYYSPPHLVEFRLQNIYGNPISDVSVTAIGYETTMGSWSWLYSIFGYKNETQIHNTTMDGTTDTMGHLSFMMVETVKYKMDFVKESEGINKTMYFYPKESQYLIILTPTIQPDMIDYISWNLSVEEIVGDSSNRSLNFTYTDSMGKTSQICFFIKDENKTELYSTCSFADDSLVDTGHTVAKSSGATYFWGFNCTHDIFGEIKGTKAITFKSRLIDLQLTNESYYSWISIALLVMITSLFSAVTVKFGYIVVPFMSGLFFYLGWLEIAPTLLTVIIILGILLYIGRRERESGL